MERKKGWLTSGAFAALCGTTKETLRHYKDISLLPLPIVPIPHSGTSISSEFWEIQTGRRAAASGWGTTKRAADFVAKHKIRCIPCDNIEWINRLLLIRRRLARFGRRLPLSAWKGNRNRSLCLKGRVLPRRKAIDQLNVIDFIIHNIAPCPQLYGHHTGGQRILKLFVLWQPTLPPLPNGV